MLALNEPIIFKYGNILLDDNSSENSVSYFFKNPIEIIIANRPDEIESALEKIESAKKNGFYIAGFFSYELGHCFEEKLKLLYQESQLPLIFCGIYSYKRPVKNKVLTKYLCKINSAAFFHINTGKTSISEEEYSKTIDNIHKEITKGTIYQANYTFDIEYEYKGNLSLLFQKIRERQKAKYGAIINMGDYKFISQSPELFVKITGDSIETHPMKGTVKRGNSKKEDKEISNRLLNDEKNKAENLMIVDLMRNDLSRISKTGTVKVPKLFEIEEYPTLFQMISIVKSMLKPNITIESILRSIFPCGSVTGAPKISAMQIINSNEHRSRGLYCGSIGYFHKDSGILNVAIRTLEIKDKIKLSVGSGIVYDSIAQSEYNECLLKAKFLNDIGSDFGILEAILWDEEFKHLELHLKRLKKSAAYFGYNYDEDIIRAKLFEYTKPLKTPSKIRLELRENGDLSLSHTPVITNDKPFLICLAEQIMDRKNPFLYHKTTNRGFYENELKKFSQKGYNEIIFLNDKGEITEGARTNIFIKKNNILYTPMVSCGLLNGILRQTLIEKGAIETILKSEDLLNADKIYVGNSIRGLKKAIFKP